MKSFEKGCFLTTKIRSFARSFARSFQVVSEAVFDRPFESRTRGLCRCVDIEGLSPFLSQILFGVSAKPLGDTFSYSSGSPIKSVSVTFA